jgi:hypothetical protein
MSEAILFILGGIAVIALSLAWARKGLPEHLQGSTRPRSEPTHYAPARRGLTAWSSPLH